MNILLVIDQAFSDRKRPEILFSSKQLSPGELEEVLAFENKTWKQVDAELLEENFGVFFWFSAEAFCYFLPGLCSAGIRENRSDLLVNDSIIQMLDRSPNPEYWDQSFLNRWTLLNQTECEAIQEWILWLSSIDSYMDDASLTRSFDTMELLKERKQNSLGSV